MKPLPIVWAIKQLPSITTAFFKIHYKGILDLKFEVVKWGFFDFPSKTYYLQMLNNLQSLWFASTQIVNNRHFHSTVCLVFYTVHHYKTTNSSQLVYDKWIESRKLGFFYFFNYLKLIKKKLANHNYSKNLQIISQLN